MQRKLCEFECKRHGKPYLVLINDLAFELRAGFIFFKAEIWIYIPPFLKGNPWRCLLCHIHWSNGRISTEYMWAKNSSSHILTFRTRSCLRWSVGKCWSGAFGSPGPRLGHGPHGPQLPMRTARLSPRSWRRKRGEPKSDEINGTSRTLKWTYCTI